MGRMSKNYRNKDHAWCVRTLVRRDGAVCGICRDPISNFKDITLDHIVPRSKGGVDSIENLQLAHQSCNQAKGAA